LKARPYEIIEELYCERLNRQEQDILAELSALPILPDEEDEAWNDDQTWRQAYLYMALVDVAAQRKLTSAVVPLLEKASYGDPGEMMRGLRNRLEAIAAPDWQKLAHICSSLSKHPHKGTRLWSVHQLGILREPEALANLTDALSDPADLVRSEACYSLVMLCQSNPQCRDAALRGLRKLKERSTERSQDYSVAEAAISHILKIV
jgi:HEAT repeat protein